MNSSRLLSKLDKVEAKIKFYQEKISLLEYNFKVEMKHFVQYNFESKQMVIDKKFIWESTDNIKSAQEKLEFYTRERKKLENSLINEESKSDWNVSSSSPWISSPWTFKMKENREKNLHHL